MLKILLLLLVTASSIQSLASEKELKCQLLSASSGKPDLKEFGMKLTVPLAPEPDLSQMPESVSDNELLAQEILVTNSQYQPWAQKYYTAERRLNLKNLHPVEADGSHGSLKLHTLAGSLPTLADEHENIRREISVTYYGTHDFFVTVTRIETSFRGGNSVDIYRCEQN
jgi:hypothetical protein